jgi:mono/diheme cytochrome c family protein
VQVIGDDYTNSPPAHALGNRGIINNLVGYSVIGDYSQEAPPAHIMDAVVAGASTSPSSGARWPAGTRSTRRCPSSLVPVQPQVDLPYLPFVFDIAMGVRPEDVELKEELDEVLLRRAADIDAILTSTACPGPGRVAAGISGVMRRQPAGSWLRARAVWSHASRRSGPPRTSARGLKSRRPVSHAALRPDVARSRRAACRPADRATRTRARRRGRRYYMAFNCAGCHGVRGGGGIGPPFAVPTFIYGNAPGNIFQSIVQGRPHGMPAYGGKAPDEVLWMIAAYVESLSRPHQRDGGGG